MKYRPDIDGLRAIAVLSVIIFHINDKLLPGGFVGVDIFFVISGYLISLHIFGELRNGCFSITEFYRRRIKRIAPAMLVVLAVTFIMAQLLFRPEDAEETARSGFWALMSLSNVYFWLFQDTSYFADSSNQLPLLHLWSLGVEEQFYVFWPIILLVTYRRSKSGSFMISMLLIAVASFMFGQFYFSRDPSFVYYMLPARAGELLTGAIAAHHISTSTRQSIPRSAVIVIASAGIALVLGSLLLISEEAVFPGYRAIPPTIGTTLLIVAGHYGQSWPTQILQVKAFVWVGLVSYSAYLWHWPILAFLRYGQFTIGYQIGIAVIFLTFLLAWMTYQYVEQPLRRSRLPFIQIALRQFVIPAAVIGLAALVSMKMDGFAFRWLVEDYENRIAQVRDSTRPAYTYDYVCQIQRIEATDIDDPACIVGAESGDVPQVILWGDSNAAHYIGMLGAFAQEAGFRFRNIEVGSCPPIRSDPADFVAAARLADCRYSSQIVWGALDQYDTVIISAAWTGYQSRSVSFLMQFEDTVQALSDRNQRVIILGRAPIISGYDRRCREKAVSFPLVDCKAPPVPIPENVELINSQLSAIAERYTGVEYFDANQYLCPRGICPIFDEFGDPIYYDLGHLTLKASWQLGSEIIQAGGVPRPFALLGKSEYR